MKQAKIARKEDGMKDHRLLLIILLLGIAILVIPYLARFLMGNSSLVSEQPYLHARMAEGELENEDSDNRIVGERTLWFTPYHLLLGMLGRVIGTEKASMVLPAVLGIMTLFLCYLLLREFIKSSMTRFVMLLALLLSPAYIYTYTVSNPHALAIVLTLLGFVCFLQKERYFYVLSIAAFALASLFQFFNALLIIYLLVVYNLTTKNKKNEIFLIIFVLLGIFILYKAPLAIRYEIVEGTLIQEVFSDLGGKTGFGIFYAILFIIGFFASWGKKYTHAGMYLLLCLLIASYHWLGNATMIYLNFFLVYFAGIGLVRLQRIHWEFNIIRNLTFLIIICGLLFSSISYINRLSHASPSQELAESLEWLAEHSYGDAVVLSHYHYGYAVEHVAKRRVVIDSLFSSFPDIDQRMADVQNLFYTLNLEEARQILEKYGITYIVVDKEMREGLVWDEPEQGLLYLFHNGETFKKAYESEGVEVWKVI